MSKITVRSVTLMAILLVVVAGLSAGVTYLIMASQSPRSSSTDGSTLRLEGETSVDRVSAEVSPSVVSISTEVNNTVTAKQGAGTGIIVSDDGYVVTNKHVVSGADDVVVTTFDGTIYDDVEIIGQDPLNDVAFLRIGNASGLKAARIGDSSAVKVGQDVIAIGNTLGEYQNTVTSGIVSGLGRPAIASSQSSGSASSLTDLIQTDAAINPGNSGGPLVNLAGEVIGINTAIVSGAQGIGFAIPINAIKGMLDGVLKNGKVERAYLGVNYKDITPLVAKQNNLPVKRGALVLGSGGVESGGPADKAGIKSGDIITKIGDLAVGQHGSVGSLVAKYTPGEVIKVTLLRDGEEKVVDATLGTYRANSDLSSASGSTEDESGDVSDFGGLFGF